MQENIKQKIQCQICLENCQLINESLLKPNNKISCNCIFSTCIECLFNWTLENVTSRLSPKQEIKCMNQECPQQMLLFDILVIFSKEQKEKISDITIKRYFSNTEDCLPCQNCSIYSYGFDKNNDCKDPFACPHCEQICYIQENQSILTTLYELFLTDPCPSCGVYIQKTGGCSTMECKKCDYKFCWYCKKPGESLHNRKQCIGHQAAKWFIYSNITTNIFLILNLQTYIGILIQAILSSIGNIFFGSFILKFFFYNLLLVFVGMTILGIKSTVEIITIIVKENQKGTFIENHQKKRRKFIKKTIFTLLMSILEILIIDFNNCFYDMLQFILKEILLITGFVVIYAIISVTAHYIKLAKKSKKNQPSVYQYKYNDWLSKVSKEKNRK